jgi:serine/threonine protein kinase
MMTPLYASYEQLDKQDARPSFDIWSLGINLYTLMARKEPYIEDSIEKLKIAILSITREKLSENYSQSLRDLVDKCLNTDPDSRPTIEQVLRYPLVRAELTNILSDFLPLTYDYPTAMTAHLV